MKIFRSILKVFFFTSVVLLFGQIQIGRTTIGKWFADEVHAGWKAGTDAVQSSHWYASMTELPLLSSWLRGPIPTSMEKEKPKTIRTRRSKIEVPKIEVPKIVVSKIEAPPIEQGKVEKDVETDGEKITSADRESLIRLLE